MVFVRLLSSLVYFIMIIFQLLRINKIINQLSNLKEVKKKLNADLGKSEIRQQRLFIRSRLSLVDFISGGAIVLGTVFGPILILGLILFTAKIGFVLVLIGVVLFPIWLVVFIFGIVGVIISNQRIRKRYLANHSNNELRLFAYPDDLMTQLKKERVIIIKLMAVAEIMAIIIVY